MLREISAAEKRTSTGDGGGTPGQVKRNKILLIITLHGTINSSSLKNLYRLRRFQS